MDDTWLGHGRSLLCTSVEIDDPRSTRNDTTTERGPNRQDAQEALTCKWTLAYRVGVGDVFKALADPTRRAILDELQDRNGQTLFELCVRLTARHGIDSTRQAISQHLDVLDEAGLVHVRRVGRYRFHDLDTSPLREISERWSIDQAEED